VTKPKLRGSWGGKIEAQGVLGSQNRTSGELRGRIGVGPGELWAGSGRSTGIRGGPPRNFGPIFFHFQAKKKEGHLSKKSFPSGSAETGAEKMFDSFLR